MSIAIKIENLSKQYRLGLVSTRTLSHDFNRWWQTSILGREDPYLKVGETNVRELKGTSEYVWALKDINLEVEEGEVLGIIGKNGAGKSTLLKILSKVTSPTTGVIKARGRVASLLEVGTGFHQEMTGRENIYLNGAILGMTKTEINKKLDEIIDFAGVERYIDTPVKRYSSGMMVRLGFAVAAHLDPEILVVDEVLAVGDAEFQKKAIGKMQDVSRHSGRTVLFVSHNMSSIKKLCSSGLLLKEGQIKYFGSVNDTIKEYLSVFNNDSFVNHIKFDFNGKEVQIMEAKLDYKNQNKFHHNINIYSEIYLYIKYFFKDSISKVHLTYIINNEDGEPVLFCDRMDYHGFYAKVENGFYETTLKIPNPLLLPGRYSITLGCASAETWEDDHKYDILTFEVTDLESNRIQKRQGYVFMPTPWELNKINS